MCFAISVCVHAAFVCCCVVSVIVLLLYVRGCCCGWLYVACCVCVLCYLDVVCSVLFPCVRSFVSCLLSVV